MTASELYELVKDLPREVWPLGLKCVDLGGGGLHWWLTPNHIDSVDAAALFTAKLVEVLGAGGGFCGDGLHQCDDGSWKLQHDTRGYATGPTLLHALIAAYKGASNG